jgi:CCR4-NOT transcription complex subunit 4
MLNEKQQPTMSDDEDETICPLCVEEMDLSDKNFLPCPCGYRVSLRFSPLGFTE